jgi:methyltransferase-like protein/2-polyprenyl-3-methyl-5-hydroxy-6-metoxy-1,4-benzoquinol methylase
MPSKNSANKSEASTSYDILPYPPYSFPATHIGRLGAIGRVFGLPTVDPAKSRVLELGCGVGVNIMAMAQLFPEAEFVGIDASQKQIDTGLEAIKSTGLKNVRLIAADFSKLEEDLGKFDYIIVHGIYSWVPDSVKESILSIGSKNLNAGGVTYISYNCLPGWRMRGALRDMMLMHTAGIPDLLGKVSQAKALLKFLAESCAQETPYGKYLAQELEMIAKVDDSYIAHEFLESDNQALYFSDFLKSADQHGLLYLGDADPATMVSDNLPAKAAETIKSLKLNLLATEQYMDFVRNRMFRSTLLCHAGSTLNRAISPERLEDLHITSLITLKQPHNGGQPAVFVSASGLEFTVSDNITAAVFEAVAKLGRDTQSAGDFLSHVVPVLAAHKNAKDVETLRATAAQLLIQGYFKKMLDFSLGLVSQVSSDGKNPVTLPLARWQASEGHRVSTIRLDMLNADQFVAKLITLCDGVRDREALIAGIMQALENKEFVLNENNQPITDTARLKVVVEQLYDGGVKNLQTLGLLVPQAS